MMRIKLWPDLVEWPLEATVDGDVITINGEGFDFSPLKDGQRLPCSAIDSQYFVGSEFIERKGKTLYMTLRFPVSWDSPEEYRNPSEHIVIDARKGVVKFPDASPVIEPQPVIEIPEPEEPAND